MVEALREREGSRGDDDSSREEIREGRFDIMMTECVTELPYCSRQETIQR
ncbi:uncharacterized protein EAE97_011609 [Botrytis byssoidea]|uniref:Uncharacterized protein n=1 Tax=Botrytis byssoidea TaxID=139641 RepID=A0A9P5HUJ8_9HELO|nr:uncharacterized protein EAE97_011609 [Botrytis byssoidea]KAF7919691.1 hypothetical protein EAE97_011609 [Botrytis byssoidea]